MENNKVFLETEESIKPKKKTKPKEKPLTEEKFNEILGEHYFAIEELINSKYKAMEEFIKAELNHVCYRIYNGTKVEMRKWNTGHYNNYEK